MPPPGLRAAHGPIDSPAAWLLGQDLGPGTHLQGRHVPGLSPGLPSLSEGLVLPLATTLGRHRQPDEL